MSRRRADNVLTPEDVGELADVIDEATEEEHDELLTNLMLHCWQTRNAQDT